MPTQRSSKRRITPTSRLRGDGKPNAGLINMLEHAIDKVEAGEVDEAKQLAHLAASGSSCIAYAVIPLAIDGLEIVVRRDLLGDGDKILPDPALVELIEEANQKAAFDAAGSVDIAIVANRYIYKVVNELVAEGNVEALQELLCSMVDGFTMNTWDEKNSRVQHTIIHLVFEQTCEHEARRAIAKARGAA